MVYLFLGDDPASKDTQLKKLKSTFLPKNLEQFNLDTLYARDLTLKNLQEKLLNLPVNNSKRVIIVKEAQDLKDALKEFLLEYIKKPEKHVVLVLDANRVDKRDTFINTALNYAKVLRFKETPQISTFTLIRCIESKRADSALTVLNQLLRQGERPERILGGLRHDWEKATGISLELKKKLKLFLRCDIEIKTGKLKPAFALEKLVVSLCTLVNTLH
jgi:DNA polymerase III delta subunit